MRDPVSAAPARLYTRSTDLRIAALVPPPRVHRRRRFGGLVWTAVHGKFLWRPQTSGRGRSETPTALTRAADEQRSTAAHRRGLGGRARPQAAAQRARSRSLNPTEAVLHNGVTARPKFSIRAPRRAKRRHVLHVAESDEAATLYGIEVGSRLRWPQLSCARRADRPPRQ